MKRKSNETKQDASSRPPMRPQHTERLFAAIHRLLAERDFKSPEEADQFLQEQLAAGALDWEELGPGPEASPLEQAQELFYQALDAPSHAQQGKMAREALSISKDCADAWLLLAQAHSRTMTEALNHVEEAMAAAKRALGPKRFDEYRGYFWGVPETRPYMRAREMLAEGLFDRGRTEEAIAHWEEMLELNPNDNQGIRTRLSLAYLTTGAQEKAALLFKRFPDDASCEMAYDRVVHLLALGKEAAASKALRQALKINRFVPDYLLRRRRVPRHLPETVTWGGKDEAGLYAADRGQLWRDTRGALKMLREPR